MKRLAAFAPFLLLGPLSGPLACGALAYSRARRPAMAAICVLGILDVYFGIPLAIAKLLVVIQHHA